MTEPSLLSFPTEFPIKVMGRDTPEFQRAVTDIVQRHAGDAGPLKVSSRPSAGGNFVAVTVVFEARNQAQLDAIYRDLSAHELVLLAL